jgi:hypothetical protein
MPRVAAACRRLLPRKGKKRATLARGPSSRRLEAEAKLLVQAQEFHTGDAGSGRQCRGQMNGVQGADRLRGKRSPRSVNDIRGARAPAWRRTPARTSGASPADGRGRVRTTIGRRLGADRVITRRARAGRSAAPSPQTCRLSARPIELSISQGSGMGQF